MGVFIWWALSPVPAWSWVVVLCRSTTQWVRGFLDATRSCITAAVGEAEADNSSGGGGGGGGEASAAPKEDSWWPIEVVHKEKAGVPTTTTS